MLLKIYMLAVKYLYFKFFHELKDFKNSHIDILISVLKNCHCHKNCCYRTNPRCFAHIGSEWREEACGKESCVAYNVQFSPIKFRVQTK